MSSNDAVNYLDSALRLANQTPDGSVLKYGLKSLIGKVLNPESDDSGQVAGIVLRYALNLSFHQPVLLPLLESLFEVEMSLDGNFQHVDELQALLCEHVRLSHTDAISWILYYSIKYGVPIRDHIACRIVESQDCIPLLLLSQSGYQNHLDKVVNFANELSGEDLYRLDQYWLLLYELVFHQRIDNPYRTKASKTTSFEILKSEGVSFTRPATLARSSSPS